MSIATAVMVPELPTGNLDLTYLSDASLQYSAQLETRIQILDGQGTVLVDSRQEEQGQSLRSNPLVAHALSGAALHEFDLAFSGVEDSEDLRFLRGLAHWVLTRA